jgi:hypothetical protein
VSQNGSVPAIYKWTTDSNGNTVDINYYFVFNGNSDYFPFVDYKYPNNDNNNIRNVIQGISWFGVNKQCIKQIEEVKNKKRSISIQSVDLPVLKSNVLVTIASFLYPHIHHDLLFKLIHYNVAFLNERFAATLVRNKRTRIC